MQTLLVTDRVEAWEFLSDQVSIICADDYLTQAVYQTNTAFRIINLCQSYRYQSLGYYVSLLAQARAQKIIPSVTTIQDLKNQSLAKAISEEIDKEIQSSLKDIKSKNFFLSVYFGKNLAKRYTLLTKKLHQLFPSPLFRVEFERQKKWKIKKIQMISISQVPDIHDSFFRETALTYFSKKRFYAGKASQTMYDLAILIDSKEKNPPSNQTALNKFDVIGESLGFHVSFIEKDDYKTIAEFDALFIRETTAVNHHTYRFARKAIAERIPVLDDPISILKCANKVYLAELLKKQRIKMPSTQIFSKKNIECLKPPQFPCVLKLPDSAFSKGVIKVENEKILKQVLPDFFKQSDLVICQQFMPSDFDWRIGILNAEPLYACKYYMAKDHWQIYNWNSIDEKEGFFETVALEKTPPIVLETALKATKHIGTGLYGVDLKMVKDQVYVIEVNDNPNIDHGVEDQILGDEMYYKILNYLLTKVRKKGMKE